MKASAPDRKKILVVLEMGLQWPSGFVRAAVYRDHFARAGYEACFVSRNFTGPLLWRFGPLFRLYARLNELRIARLARSCASVYLCKVNSPRLVGLLRRSTKARLVLDYVDAGMPQYAGADQEATLAAVDAVTVDNELTAAYARRFNPGTTVIPDCPQVEVFDAARPQVPPRPAGRPVTLGWVGAPSSAYNLFLIWEPLERVFAKHPDITLRLVGTGKDPRVLPPFEKVRYTCLESYTQREMVQEVLRMDIGLFPLYDVTASRYRGVLKASVYMSGGAAVIGSPVGQCSDFIAEGVNGLLAATPQDWERKLDLLITDAKLRAKLAEGGLATVRGSLTLDRSFGRLLKVLEGKANE